MRFRFSPIFLAGFLCTFSVGGASGQTDRDALIALYNSTDGENWVRNDNWNTEEDISTWFGVTAEGGRVTRVDMRRNNLSGTLPSEIGDLSALTWLALRQNSLTGSIPAEVGKLAALTWFDLRENRLTGPIPSTLRQLSELEVVFLRVNALTGPIPPWITEMSGLRILDLSSNDLTGPIPTDIGALSQLENLWLAGNQITGELPASIGSISTLRQVFLSGTRLSGRLPRTLLQVPTCTEFNGCNGMGLYRFSYHVSGLCAPPDEEFTAWLAGIADSGGATCSDTTALTVTIASEAAEPVSGPFSVTVTFSEPVTGFELADLVVGNGAASDLQGSAASYAATITPAASGAVTVDIAAGAAEDAASNPSAAADQFSITADLRPVLSGLVLSDYSGEVALAPAFDSATQHYTATVANDITSVTVTPTAADASATVTVNGTAVASGSPSGAIDLDVGENDVAVVVTAEDRRPRTYTVTVTRATPATDATLSGLALSHGTLTPAFDSATQHYTADVANTVTSVTVTPTATDASATVTVNGASVASGSASGAIDLDVGDNDIAVAVTAEDGATTVTYTVTMTRAASTDPTLSGLVLSDGTQEIALTPAFDSGTHSYTANVASTVTSVTVTPTATDASATVAVNGASVASGSASGAIDLEVGENDIAVVVTAESGTLTLTYTVTVTRPASTDATLSGLVLSDGTQEVALTPAFDSATHSYTATVANSITSVTVTPTATDASATVTVNGASVASGSASGAMDLEVGENDITVVVTAEDGTTTLTYMVAVTRAAPSTDATLSGLVLSDGMQEVALMPAFDSATHGYTATVANDVTSVTVAPTVTDASATVTVNGATVASGSPSGAIALEVGENDITVVVTAEDGTTTLTYTVTVTKMTPVPAMPLGGALLLGVLLTCLVGRRYWDLRRLQASRLE